MALYHEMRAVSSDPVRVRSIAVVIDRITDAAWTAMITICDEIDWDRSLIDDDKAKATMRAWIIDALKKPAA